MSLNAATEEEYRRIGRPIEDRYRLENVIRFLEEAKQEIGEVRASAVDVPEVDMEAVREMAESRLGVSFRRRG